MLLAREVAVLLDPNDLRLVAPRELALLQRAPRRVVARRLVGADDDDEGQRLVGLGRLAQQLLAVRSEADDHLGDERRVECVRSALRLEGEEGAERAERRVGVGEG